MLLCIVHHLQNDATLAGHADATGCHSLLNLTGCLNSIETLAGGNPVGPRCSHLQCCARAVDSKQECIGSKRSTTSYIPYATNTKRNTTPTCTKRSTKPRL